MDILARQGRFQGYIIIAIMVIFTGLVFHTSRLSTKHNDLHALLNEARDERNAIQSKVEDLRIEMAGCRAILEESRDLVRSLESLCDTRSRSQKADDDARDDGSGLHWGRLKEVDHRGREWKSRLWNIPHGHDWMKTCERTPLKGRKGVSGMPNWCEHKGLVSPHL
jgi:hypothetical protein